MPVNATGALQITKTRRGNRTNVSETGPPVAHGSYHGRLTHSKSVILLQDMMIC